MIQEIFFCRFIWPHHLDCILLEVYFANRPIQPEEMLQNLYGLYLTESCELVNNCWQEKFLHRPEDLIFNCPVYGSAASEDCLVFTDPFGYNRLFLGGHHFRGLIFGVMWRYRRMDRLIQVVLCSHFEYEVAMLPSSEVWCHRCHISTDQSLNIY